MAPVRPQPFSVLGALAGVSFLRDRTPHTTEEEAADSFAVLARYRDGSIVVGHWAGNSEWERHPVADEIVMVIDGTTTILLLDEGGEHSARLNAGDLVVVPEGVWHRFETPEGVKLLSVTPQPTDHALQRPG